MDCSKPGWTSNESLDSAYHMPRTENRAPAHRHRSTGARLAHLSENESRPGSRRPPESSPPSPGGSSSTSDHRSSRLAGAARAGSVACYAAGFLVAVAAFLSLPLQARAQTTITLVSNTGGTTTASTTSISAQPFTTGSNSGGYTLTSVVLGVGNYIEDLSILVRIVPSTLLNLPDESDSTKIITLTNPASVTGFALNTFTAPANTTLSADTTYHVLVTNADADAAVGVHRTSSNAEDDGAADGWSIGDTRYWKATIPDAWSSSTTSFLRIQINGYANTTTLSTDATLSDLELEGATGSEPILLSPVFDSATETYTASVANRIDAVTLTATKNDATAMVAITSDDDTNTKGEAELDLSVGSNTLTVTVTAADTTTKTYTITVTRAAAPPAPTDCPADTDWCTTLGVGYATESTALFKLDYWGYRSERCYGDLLSTTFSHGGTSYTVSAVERTKITNLAGNTVVTANLILRISPALPDGTVLQLGSRTFTVDTDSETSNPNQEQWNILNNPLSWTAGQHVTASLKFPTVDTTPPALSSGEVRPNGVELFLTFSEDLDLATQVLPAAVVGAFSITAAGLDVEISAVTAQAAENGLKITLQSPAKIVQGQTVTLSYDRSAAGTDALEDDADNEVASFTDFAVTNNSIVVPDTTPPALSSGEVRPNAVELFLTFSEDLDLATQVLPAAVVGAFSVTAAGLDVEISAVTAQAAENGLKITLQSPAKIAQGQTVTLSYDKTEAGTDALEDDAGNEVASFTDFAVTNNSALDTTPPALSSAEVRPNGVELFLTFSEDLDLATQVLPAAVVGAFSITAAGLDVEISAVTAQAAENGLKITLQSPAKIAQGQTVTLSYDKTEAGTDALEDDAGNEVASFTDFAVTNNSALDTTPRRCRARRCGQTAWSSS